MALRVIADSTCYFPLACRNESIAHLRRIAQPQFELFLCLGLFELRTEQVLGITCFDHTLRARKEALIVFCVEVCPKLWPSR